MSVIMMLGASSDKGGFVAKGLEDQGNKVFKVGKGGPDFNLDLKFVTEDAVRQAFRVCLDRMKEYPKHLVLNTFKGSDTESLDLGLGETGASFYINVLGPMCFALEFLRLHKKHYVRTEPNDVPRIIVVGKSWKNALEHSTQGALASFFHYLPISYRGDEVNYMCCLLAYKNTREETLEIVKDALEMPVPSDAKLPITLSVCW